MSLPVHIVGPNGQEVEVSRSGELAVSPVSYDQTVFKELAEPDTAYNFFEPKTRQQLVLTGINAKADRQVSNTVDADVIVYEADDVDSTTVSKVLFQEAMIRGEKAELIPLRILVNPGKWVNAKTTDDDIHMTLMGYFIEEL